MTDDTMALRGLSEKPSDADRLREMINFAAQRVMGLEMANLTGAAPGERSESRIHQRSGFRERNWQTRAGTVELRIPNCAVAATSRPYSRPGKSPRTR